MIKSRSSATCFHNAASISRFTISLNHKVDFAYLSVKPGIVIIVSSALLVLGASLSSLSLSLLQSQSWWLTSGAFPLPINIGLFLYLVRCCTLAFEVAEYLYTSPITSRHLKKRKWYIKKPYKVFFYQYTRNYEHERFTQNIKSSLINNI